MKLCEGRIAIVTGGARGVGRAYCTMLAAHGAKVVVNDLGGAVDGSGSSATAADEAVAAIVEKGGEAIADTSDVADWRAAQGLVKRTVDRFGRLDILINNAGTLRDRMLVNMTEGEWDSVVRVHLKGTFAPLHHAANHWRLRHKAGDQVDGRVINTTSHSALFGNIGQANYAAAKGGIAALTIVAARELQRMGVTVNAVAPRAHTRMTEGLREWTEEQLDRRQPEWVAALVTWLASTQSAHISGRVFEAWGYGFGVAEGWQHGPVAEASKDPTVLAERINEMLCHARGNAGLDRDTWSNP